MSDVALCKASEIEPGEIRQAVLEDGHRLAIYNVDGEFFATADLCTHGEASLSEDGLLEGPIVECSWHNGKFDVRTGAACGMPCAVAIQTFKVVVEDGTVVLREDAS